VTRFACLSPVLTAVLALSAGSSSVVLAADKQPKPPAYLTVEEAGPDYQLQGEYRGWQRSRGSDRSSESIGLQVTAIGNDQFAGTKYYGGLPGAGWRHKSRFEYTGQKAGDIVRLSSPDYTFEVDGKTAEIFSPDGLHVGQLQKVHRVSPTMGARPPAGAIVLFDGNAKCGFKDPKVTKEGWLREGTETIDAYGDFRLHGEFMLPFKPLGRGQDRGNSGFYLQGRYEVQVLDSFGHIGVENECGSIYRVHRPDINMCLPPLAWQTYDIDFTMPKFDDQGKKIKDMCISIWHNGVLIQDRVSIHNKTGNGLAEGPNALPTKLQDHGNPVVYRNLWILPKTKENADDNNWLKLPLSGPPTPISMSEPAGIIRVNPAGVVMLSPGI